jgi:uncharacterized 2Fe-2S/4Fe-4S cluster protein (DUF4445 family)
MCKSWETGIVPGYETKIVQVGNCTVRIHSPILTKEEQARREEELKNALANLGRSMNHEKNH